MGARAPSGPSDPAETTPDPAQPETLAHRAACRSCFAPIVFVATAGGQVMPLDLHPDERGNVAVVVVEDGVRQAVFAHSGRGVATVLPADDLVRARLAGAPLYMPHFATCPDAKRYRRGPR